MPVATSTLAMIAIGGSLLSGGIGAMGAMQSAQAQSASAQYNAAVARNNQTIAQQNADLALKQGQVQEDTQRQKTAQLIGGVRAGIAAQGRTLDSGSALDVQSSAAETGELDALTIRSNAAIKSKAYLNDASNFGAQAGLLDAQAGWASQAGIMGGITSILGGASGVSDKWARYRKDGIM